MSQYATFFARELTFKNMGWEAPSPSLEASEMARAGFFCIHKECVECAYCGQMLEGWKAGEDPFTEHKRHSGECPYIKLFKTPPTKITLMEAIKLEIGRLRLQTVKELEKNIQELEKYS